MSYNLKDLFIFKTTLFYPEYDVLLRKRCYESKVISINLSNTNTVHQPIDFEAKSHEEETSTRHDKEMKSFNAAELTWVERSKGICDRDLIRWDAQTTFFSSSSTSDKGTQFPSSIL